MRYQKEPTAAQTESMMQALRFAMKNGNEFMIMADIGPNALTAGSGRLSLVEFMVKCMIADQQTAELFINVVMNFMSNKILNELCGNCDKADICEKRENNCDPETLYSDIQAQLELALKLTKSGMN